MRSAKHWGEKLGVDRAEVLRVQREAFDQGAEMCAAYMTPLLDKLFEDLGATLGEIMGAFTERVDKMPTPASPKELKGRP